ncbi:MAG: hypothetical protein NVSMB16_07430 [Acidimicrobiales bacterium]
MILSDRTIREQIANGRIEIDPLDERDIQPSSVDLHIDRYFRVFRNHTMRVIDVKEDQEELTELVEINEDDPFILHPGEFVLGSTHERVKLPNDLVARLEGKSSLGRLGLLIHSSLPGSEPVVILHDGRVESIPIEEIVRKQIPGSVVAFDPDTFEISYQEITGWYEGPPDRIFEVRLASGRSVRVTAGHNLFTLDRDGALAKTRTAALAKGTRVAIPGRIPAADLPAPLVRMLDLAPEGFLERLVVEGPTVDQAFIDHAGSLGAALVEAGYRHVDFYRAQGALPLDVARQVPGLVDALGDTDRVRTRGGRNGVPAVFEIDTELAWLFGIYVAEGFRRRGQIVISNTEQAKLDRAAAALASLGLPVHCAPGVAITCSSIALSELFSWMGMGGHAPTKRMPSGFLGWPEHLQEALLEAMMDGDGSRGEATRDSYWSSSAGLVSDVLLLMERLGRRAAAWHRDRSPAGLYQVGMPRREHKLLTSVPLPDRLICALRKQANLTQVQLARLAGYRRATDVCNIERRSGRDAVRRGTLRRLRDALAPVVDTSALDRLVDGDLAWDQVLEVRDTGVVETIFDIEVRPGGRHIENFLAGSGGVLVSNTAGFVDAGWDGQLTLELSNVANLPITLYPGMKIGQISFLQMTTDAEHPYGSGSVGSKYQHQVGPRPSRYFENFRGRPTT